MSFIDTIVQGVYRPAAIEHVPIETQTCQVVPEPSGRLTIYSCTQALYFSMGVVAAHLQVPLNKLKFVGGTTGGGFGGKVDTATETMCCLLAMKSGKPVKWRWTREEEFLCSSTRAPWHMEIADAVTKDGWILGRKMLTLHDAGAYARFLVGQPLPLVGQRTQALADQPPSTHHQRPGTRLTAPHRAAHLDQVAEVHGVGEVRCGAIV